MDPNTSAAEKLIAINDDWTSGYNIPRLKPTDEAMLTEKKGVFINQLKAFPLDEVHLKGEFKILKFHLDLRNSKPIQRLAMDIELYQNLKSRCTREGLLLLHCHDGTEHFSPESRKATRGINKFNLAHFGNGEGPIYGRKGLVWSKRYYRSTTGPLEFVAKEIDKKNSQFKILKGENVERVWKAYSEQAIKEFLYDLHAQATLAQVVLQGNGRETSAVERFEAQIEYLHLYLTTNTTSKPKDIYGLTNLSKLYSFRKYFVETEFFTLIAKPKEGSLPPSWNPVETGQWDNWYKALEKAILK